jgi:uncharacterized protein (TIGR01370 family)
MAHRSLYWIGFGLIAGITLSLLTLRAEDEVLLNEVAVKSWAFQLQGPNGADLDLGPIAAFPADLAVIDYSRNGGESGEFTPTETEALRQSGKLVLSYISIGAADVGRFYDRDPSDPSSPFSSPEGDVLLGSENENFPGTFFVRFWSADWRNIIFGDDPLPEWVNTSDPERRNYLERVLAAGFDGVYLDDVDAYQRFSAELGDGSRPSAALEMLLFIHQISTWAKAKRPGLIVYPQNGENLTGDALDDLDANLDEQLDSADPYVAVAGGVIYIDVDDDGVVGVRDISLAALDANGDGALTRAEIEEAYFGAIDGLGAEDFFFKGDLREDNPFIDTLPPGDPRIDDFKFTGDNYLRYAERGLPIFTVEYLTDANASGLRSYCDAVADSFEFSNPEIPADTDSPAFTAEELRSLTLIPFQAPSRDLDALPIAPLASICDQRSHD